MPSPFPGMNPYLESEEVFHDFHERFIPYAAEAIAPQVRPAYIVKLDENVYIHELSAESRGLVGRPDVAIAKGKRDYATAQSQSGIATLPVYKRLPAEDIERLSFIEIQDRDSRELITAIELLSASNKGSDRRQYLSKRRQYLSAGVRLVELDLLRNGARLPLEDPPACDYCALVSRPEQLPEVAVWPIRLRDRLPIVPIPLRGGHPDAHLNIQQVLDRVYDAAGYVDYIYSDPPQPPLSHDDVGWAEQFAPPRD